MNDKHNLGLPFEYQQNSEYFDAHNIFEKTLQNIYANLNDSGVYVFDIFNLQAITDNIIADFSMDMLKVASNA